MISSWALFTLFSIYRLTSHLPKKIVQNRHQLIYRTHNYECKSTNNVP